MASNSGGGISAGMAGPSVAACSLHMSCEQDWSLERSEHCFPRANPEDGGSKSQCGPIGLQGSGQGRVGLRKWAAHLKPEIPVAKWESQGHAKQNPCISKLIHESLKLGTTQLSTRGCIRYGL